MATKTMLLRLEVDDKGAVKVVDDIDKGAKKASDSVDQTQKSVNSLTGALDKMTGGAISGFKNMVTGAKSGVVAMGTLKTAIAATGIGALVIAVGTLITYFTKTQRGADQLRKIMGGVGAAVAVVVDRISMLGEAVVAVFAGDFQKAASLGTSALKGIGEEIVNETKAGAALAEAMAAVEKAETDMIVTSAKRRAQIDELRLSAEDLTKSEDERKAALQQAIILTKQQANEEIVIAKERFRIIKEQNALGESMLSDVKAEREAEAALFEVERNRDLMLRSLTKKTNSFREEVEKTTEALDGQKAVTEALAKAEESRLLDEEEDAFNASIDLQISYNEKKRLLDLQAVAEADKLRNEQEEADGQSAERRIAQEEAVAAAKKQLNQDVIGAAMALNNAFGNQTGKNAKASFNISKALGVAQATISGIEAVQNAFKTASGSIYTTINPAYPFIQAGLAGIFAAAKVKAIASQQFNASGGGGASIGGGGGATPTVPNVSVVGGGINATGQLAQNINDFSQRPVRAFVVSQDIESQSALDRRIRTNATFGG